MSRAVTRRRSFSCFSLGCGCKDSKSVAISAPALESSELLGRRPRDHDAPSSADALTLTTTTSSSSPWDDETASTPSFSGLLRQLGELEQRAKAWGRSSSSLTMTEVVEEVVDEKRTHRRSRSQGRVAESVAVVKESKDPLGDFRRSMLQMIVEKELVGRDELRELLQRFLSLNSPRHHDIILLAFAEIWDEVFAGHEQRSDLLPPPRHHS